MRTGAYLGNQAHAPANSRVALVSSYTSGADFLHLAVRPTADGRLVLARDDDVASSTGVSGQVGSMMLVQLASLDFSEHFRPRGAAAEAFRYFDPAVMGRRFGLDVLDDLVSELPRDVPWIVEVRPGEAGAAVAALLAARGALRRSILAFETSEAAAECQEAVQGTVTALIVADGLSLDGLDPAGCALAIVPARRLWRDGAWTSEIGSLADMIFPQGALLLADDVDDLAALVVAASAQPWAWGICARSTFDLPPRASYVHVDESFAGTVVDHSRFALGYAKANRYASVTWNDGIHVDIAPYAGPLPGSSGEPLERLEWEVIDVARTWPFYSGGGVGVTLGIADDFAAEVTYGVDRVGQATTLEMAVLNVDPGAHRGTPPDSFRDKDSFYDPHGAPPYVGVEHDEDDGFRINWNLGVEYDNNQYGRPVGDGRAPRGGRLRLERRGAHFAAYFCTPVDERGGALPPADWVCVGVVRNESLNRVLHLRCVGKRWRQEKASDPSQHEPIIPNRFTFRDLRIECFPPADGA